MRPLLLALFVLALAAPATGASTAPEREKRVVFVHGFERGGKNKCEGTWGDLLDAFRGYGWTNTLVPLRYYAKDTRCNRGGRKPIANIDISDYGRHGRVQGKHGHVKKKGKIVGHSTDARIKHLAYHFAWTVHRRYTRDGHTVEAVGHSMGGLIIRSAIHEVESGTPDFPESLLIEDVVTLGTPHTGAKIANACFVTHHQCRDLRPDSKFLNDLAASAQDPQADGGTEWTTIGAEDDNTTKSKSALGMSAPDEVLYESGQGIEHGKYMHKKPGAKGDAYTADVDVHHHGFFCFGFPRLPWPMRLTDIALTQPVYDDCNSD